MSKSIGDKSNGGAGEDIAMTLAAIAYETGYDAITNLLNVHAPDWKCVWWPDKEVNGNYAYIAYNGAQYIVAVRGSVLSFSWATFQDWFEQDFNVFEQVDWTYPSSSAKPRISLGASYGLADLTSLVMTDPVKKTQTRMLDYLLGKLTSDFDSIGVVGHSLGGGLSTVFAPWLYYQIQSAKKPIPILFPVMTFAAPAVGNQAFADAYDATFDAAYRFYNIIDIVPMASATIGNMGFMFPAPAPAASQISVTYDGITVTLQEAILTLATALEGSEWWQSSYYTQPTNNTIQFNTSKHVCPVDTKDSLIEQWFEQASCQHSRCTYLTYAGAKPFNCD